MNFDDVYAGPQKDQAKRGLFNVIFRIGIFHHPGSQRLHSNTITIKPYPDKVSSDPTAGSKAYRWWVAIAC